MTELTRERRDAIRRELDDPSVDFEPYDSTVRALLDMADERDRYRALLGDVLEDNGHAGYTTPETLNRIDAALEGNDAG